MIVVVAECAWIRRVAELAPVGVVISNLFGSPGTCRIPTLPAASDMDAFTESTNWWAAAQGGGDIQVEEGAALRCAGGRSTALHSHRGS